MHSSFWRLGKRSAWLLSSVAVLGLVLSGSAFAAAHAVQPAAKTHKSMTTVDVQLNWLTNVEFSGLWIADHFGWFKKAGFKLKATAWSPGVNPETTTEDVCYKNAPKNTLCLGFDDSSAVAIAKSVGVPLTAIWTGSQKTPFGFATCFVPKHGVNKKCTSRTHKNITSPKQWRNLNIGYQSHELYVPEIMLGSVGLNLGKVHPVTVGFDTTALTKGAVDAYLVFVNNEPIALKLSGVKVNVIPAYKFGMGAFYADTMFAPDAEIKAHKGQLKTFVHLVDKGWKWAMDNPKQAADIVEKDYFKQKGQRKQQELEEAQFAKTLSRNNHGLIDGQMTPGRWNAIIKNLKTLKDDVSGQPLIDPHSSLKAKNVFTDEFAPPPSKH